MSQRSDRTSRTLRREGPLCEELDSSSMENEAQDVLAKQQDEKTKKSESSILTLEGKKAKGDPTNRFTGADKHHAHAEFAEDCNKTMPRKRTKCSNTQNIESEETTNSARAMDERSPYAGQLIFRPTSSSMNGGVQAVECYQKIQRIVKDVKQEAEKLLYGQCLQLFQGFGSQPEPTLKTKVTIPEEVNELTMVKKELAQAREENKKLKWKIQSQQSTLKIIRRQTNELDNLLKRFTVEQ